MSHSENPRLVTTGYQKKKAVRIASLNPKWDQQITKLFHVNRFEAGPSERQRSPIPSVRIAWKNAASRSIKVNITFGGWTQTSPALWKRGRPERGIWNGKTSWVLIMERQLKGFRDWLSHASALKENNIFLSFPVEEKSYQWRIVVSYGKVLWGQWVVRHVTLPACWFYKWAQTPRAQEQKTIIRLICILLHFTCEINKSQR